jgi:hypothetical protein
VLSATFITPANAFPDWTEFENVGSFKILAIAYAMLSVIEFEKPITPIQASTTEEPAELEGTTS